MFSTVPSGANGPEAPVGSCLARDSLDGRCLQDGPDDHYARVYCCYDYYCCCNRRPRYASLCSGAHRGGRGYFVVSEDPLDEGVPELKAAHLELQSLSFLSPRLQNGLLDSYRQGRRPILNDIGNGASLSGPQGASKDTCRQPRTWPLLASISCPILLRFTTGFPGYHLHSYQSAECPQGAEGRSWDADDVLRLSEAC